MSTKTIYTILYAATCCILLSCSPGNFSSKYYFQNKQVLDKMEASYKKLYPQQPFSITFTDRKFETVSLQIITDTLSYIYEFGYNEPRLNDTLVKYHLDAPKVMELIEQVRGIQCTSINHYNYYLDEKKNSLVLMYIKPVSLHPLFSYKKYYILTYFSQPQYFDSTGRLLDKRKLHRLRKINGEVFRRINDKVCYTVSGNFR